MPTTKLDSEEEETDATVEETSSSSSSPSQRHSSLKAEPTTVFGLQKQRRVRKQRHHCLLHNNSNDDLLQSPVGFHWVPSPAAASTSSSSSSSSRSPRRQKCTRKPQISQILSFILFAVLYRLVDCQRTSPAAGAGIQKQLQQQLNSTTTNSSNGSATEETPSSSTEEEKITNFFSSSSSPSEILPSLVTESTVSTPAPLLTAKATPPGEINRSISGGSREVEDDRFPTPAVVFLTTSTSAGSRNDDDPSGGQTPIASLNQSLTQPSVSTTVKTTPSAVASAAGNLQNQQQPSDSDEDEQSTSAEEFVASSLNVSNTTTTPLQPAMKRPDHFELISFNWRHVEAPFTVALWLLLASVAKILFRAHKQFADAIPDSALLIVMGLILGYGLRQLKVDGDVFTLKSHVFFLYLLPPIIFDAGYFMPNRQLFENFDSVLLFAFVGTIWNTLAIGLTLLWLGHLQLFSVQFSAFEILLFASLISAVDPVAVIAVFEEIHINEFLFINVFGEALFNDGVSVVLYQMFRKFTLIGDTNLHWMDYVAGGTSFLVIALGGIIIGVAFCMVACVVTKFTDQVKILAPVFVFLVPYMAYLTAELLGLSSILAIVACGILMKQYIKGNITHDASSSVKYFVKMLAQCSETIIFMFLGLSTITSHHHWDCWFVLATIVLCLVYRAIGVVVQCAILNTFRKKRFSFTDQFILSYGGLRGAIAFGLVVSLPHGIAAKQMFITTCICVIMFTVFLLGITVRPVLYLLKVEKQDMDHEETVVEKVHDRVLDYTMTGIEDILGLKGSNYFRGGFERFNAKVLKPILMKHESKRHIDTSPIMRAYTKITLQEAVKLAYAGMKISKGVGHRVVPANSSPSNNTTISSTYGVGGGSGGTTRPAWIITENQASPGLSRAEGSPALALDKDNADTLYAMFSRLLDRKIEEIQAKSTKFSDYEDDIKDDYMDEIIQLTVDEEDEARRRMSVISVVSLTNCANSRLSSLPNARKATISEQLHVRRRGSNANALQATTDSPRRQWSQPIHPMQFQLPSSSPPAAENDQHKHHHHQHHQHQHRSHSSESPRTASTNVRIEFPEDFEEETQT